MKNTKGWCIFKTGNKNKGNKKLKNSKGWYIFNSGVMRWFNSLSARERKEAMAKYGDIIKFIPYQKEQEQGEKK